VSEPETTTLQHYVGVLWRRRVALLLPIVVLAVAGYLSAHHQQPLYRASSQVLLNHQDQVATSIVGVQTPVEDPSRYAATQAMVAQTPAVARRVLAAVGEPNGNVKQLLDHTYVYPTADVLVFAVREHDAAATVRLAGAWAQAYTAYRRQLDTRELSKTLAQLDDRLAGLRGAGGGDGRLAATLAAKAQDVQLLEALRRSNVYVVQSPSLDDADRIAPRPLKTTAVATAVGILVGLVLALLLEGLDSRVRPASELEEALAAPFLGRLPLRDGSALREAALAVWARLELRDRSASRLLLAAGGATDAGVAEVAAELARASARAGRSAVLVDADLRSAPLDRIFDLDPAGGTAAIASGATDEAATRLVTPGGLGGQLRVVGVGGRPDDPGALATSPALAAWLQTLRSDADDVIVVVPPIAAVGDALVLAPVAGATLLVLPGGGIARRDLQTLVRATADWPTRLTGFVLVDRPTRSAVRRVRPVPPARVPDQTAESVR
jgi:capsular polysaccharide biosynthesis protein